MDKEHQPPPATKRQYLRELVYQKNQWALPLSDEARAQGFLGWHERGYLPHADFPDLVQFITFRLADSMPVSRRGEWEHLLAIEDVREKRTKLEEYLDRGVGGCQLRDPRIARLCEEALLFVHDQRYELLAWCVMPNHVHVLVHVWDWPLSKMVQNWKIRVAMEARKIERLERRAPARHESAGKVPTGRAGARRSSSFWQREYWDTFIRNAEQERAAIHYIEANPVKAGLYRTAAEWPFGSARYRDRYERLTLPEVAR